MVFIASLILQSYSSQRIGKFILMEDDIIELSTRRKRKHLLSLASLDLDIALARLQYVRQLIAINFLSDLL